MVIVYSFISLIGIFAVILSLYGLFRKERFSFLESFSFSVMAGLNTISAVNQLIFVLNLTHAGIICDVFILLSCVLPLGLVRGRIYKDFRSLWIKCKKNKSNTIAWILLPGFMYLLLQAILLPPNNFDGMTYNLGRVMIFINENSLYPENFSTPRQVQFPFGWDILYFTFLKHYGDLFLGLFNFLALLVIISGVLRLFSLIRPDGSSWIPLLVVSSLVAVVLQSTSVKNDLALGGIAICLYLLAHRLIYSPSKKSWILLISLSIFGLNIKTYFIGFVCPALIIILATVYYKYDRREYFRSIFLKSDVIGLLSVLLIAAGLLHLITYGKLLYNNYTLWGAIFGDPASLNPWRNSDGFYGMMANAFRFIVQSVNLPARMGGGLISDRILNMIPLEMQHVGSYREMPVNLAPNAASPFASEEFSWYGPIGNIFTIPAFFYCLIKCRGLARLVSAVSLVFMVIILYSLAWNIWVQRFFIVIFVGGALCISIFFEDIGRKRRWCLLFIQFVGILSFYYAVLFNFSKPFINIYEITYKVMKYYGKSDLQNFKLKEEGLDYPGAWVLPWAKPILNRNAYVELHYFSEVLGPIKSVIPRDSSALFLTTEDGWVMPVLLALPERNVTVGRINMVIIQGKIVTPSSSVGGGLIRGNFDYLLLIGEDSSYLQWASKENALLFVPANGSGYLPLTVWDIRKFKTIKMPFDPIEGVNANSL